MNKISIALCTYNGAKFLPEQLASFLNQSVLPNEVIVNDDRSTDETAKIIEEFAKTAPFSVSLEINPKNLGSTKNFERAIARCTGDLIFLSDQDDVWHAEKISRIKEKFEEKKDVCLIFSDAELVDENLKPVGKKLWEMAFPLKKQIEARKGNWFEILLDQNVVTGATAAFRRELREKFMPIPDKIPNLIHDGWIALVASAMTSGKIEFISENLIKYRQHSNQQLGINFQARKSRNYAERKKHYENSIRFFQNEIERLYQLGKVFNENPAFENYRKFDLIGALAGEKQQLLEHYNARKNLSVNRLQRIFPIFKELLNGRYRRFSSGLASAAKDLIQKQLF